MSRSPIQSPKGVDTPRHTSREWCVLAVICLIGLGLRLYRLDHLAIEHFDEGVYTANLYANLDDYRYPQRHLYAPPLFPLLCELAIGIGGTPDAAIWVNLAFGSLMIPLVWVVARDSFGTVGGGVAATLCATSDYHVFFSRSALTDVSLGFWLLLAVWLAGRGMRSGSGLTLGGAAIAAALAWWTKYNGWLAIAIPLGGWGLLAIMSAIKTTGPLKTRLATIDREGLLRWGLFALLAALLWSPVVYGLQSVGGYSVVAKNHAGYLVGLSGWWNGLRMHFAYHGWLTSTVGVGGLLVVGALLVVLQGRRGVGLAAALVCLVPAAAVAGMGGILGVVSLVAVAWLVRDWWREPSPAPPHRLWEALCVVWWVGLTLTTPLYTPYARLSLPWLVSGWMLVGGLLARLNTACQNLRSVVQWSGGLMLLMLFGFSFAGLPETHFNKNGLSRHPAWSDRTGLRKATGQILHEIDMGRRTMPESAVSGFDAAVYVVGEPALFCHLRVASEASELNLVVKPGANMSVAAPGPPLPTFIVTGSHASATEVAEVIADGLIELIWEQKVLVSDMVALDSASFNQLAHAHKVPKSGEWPDYTIPIRIYRVRP
jgi:dolichyl-phosphate-mannose-protein mannosyltransferase